MARRLTVHCWHCGTNAEFDGPVGRGESCEKCRRDLRVCRNCRHFDPAAHNQCREPQSDRVDDREKANFCDYFDPSPTLAGRDPAIDDAKARLEKLFKK